MNNDTALWHSGFIYYYNLAKLTNFITIAISFVLAILSIYFASTASLTTDIITIICVSWTLFSLFLNQLTSNFRDKAATLQELYDVYFFKISSHDLLSLPVDTRYLIPLCFNKTYTPYYDEPLTQHTEILAAQSSNISYDKPLRKFYLAANKLFLFIYIVSILIIAISANYSVTEVILTFFIPSINICTYTLTNILNVHQELLLLKDGEIQAQNILQSINDLSEGEIQLKLRALQDFIYIKRKNWTMMPNYIYKVDKFIRNNTLKIPTTKEVPAND